MAATLRSPDVAGVVVTYGTDTTEETAFFLDLFHADPRPVVVTGAQRAADAPDSDGPRNLTDAVTAAAAPATRGLGVLIGFGVSSSRPAAPARVDVVACYPDADATALPALVDVGARGIVLEATGAGNANPATCAVVAELTAAGVVVVTSTRVAAGPVTAIYGDGGGVDLLAAGAVPSGLLRPSQARMLLAALLGLHQDPRAVRVAFAQHASGFRGK